MARCTQCVNGYVNTSIGPRPCPSCKGSGYLPDSTNSDSNSGHYSSAGGGGGLSFGHVVTGIILLIILAVVLFLER